VIFDFLTLMVAGTGKQKLDSMECRAVLAAALDLVLVCGCLAAFLVAEKECCCHVAHESSTANDSSATKSGAAMEEERWPTCFVVVCCCWHFLMRWGKQSTCMMSMLSHTINWCLCHSSAESFTLLSGNATTMLICSMS